MKRVKENIDITKRVIGVALILMFIGLPLFADASVGSAKDAIRDDSALGVIYETSDGSIRESIGRSMIIPAGQGGNQNAEATVNPFGVLFDMALSFLHSPFMAYIVAIVFLIRLTSAYFSGSDGRNDEIKKTVIQLYITVFFITAGPLIANVALSHTQG